MIKKSNEKLMGELIKELLNAYNLNDKLNETKLLQSWESVVGKMISNHTKQLFIKQQKLFVKFDNASLKHELSYARQKIVTALNEIVGDEVIKDLIIL